MAQRIVHQQLLGLDGHPRTRGQLGVFNRDDGLMLQTTALNTLPPVYAGAGMVNSPPFKVVWWPHR